MSEKEPRCPYRGVTDAAGRHILVNDGTPEEVQKWCDDFSDWLGNLKTTPEEAEKADKLIEKYKKEYEENKRKRQQQKE